MTEQVKAVLDEIRPMLQADGGDMELVEVTDKTPAGFAGTQFSLLFRGPLDVLLPQRIYPLDHPEMGRLDLFLVPVAQKKDGYRYEAFFNRQPDPAVRPRPPSHRRVQCPRLSG